MKDTHSNREALTQMVEACEGTRYHMRIRELKYGEGTDILPVLTRRENAPEYTPAVYLDDENWRPDPCLRIEVQTTSYGPLNTHDITMVAEGLTEAARLANALPELIREAAELVRAHRGMEDAYPEEYL